MIWAWPTVSTRIKSKCCCKITLSLKCINPMLQGVTALVTHLGKCLFNSWGYHNFFLCVLWYKWRKTVILSIIVYKTCEKVILKVGLSKLTQHPLNTVIFFNARLTLGIGKKKETGIVWFTAVDGTCSLDPEGGRKIRKGIRGRRRSRTDGLEKHGGLKSESERKWRKDLWTANSLLNHCQMVRSKVICTYCRHEMSYHRST